MDITNLHSLVTVLAVLAFAGIVAYAYGNKRKQHFEALGRAILDDNDDNNDLNKNGGNTHG